MSVLSNDILYKYLVELGVVDKAKLDAIYADSQAQKKSFSELLLARDLIDDENLGKIEADLQKIPYIHVSEVAIPEEILQIVPEVVAKKQHVIAFGKDEKGLKLAMSDPTNHELAQFLAKKTGLPVNIYFATESDIEKCFGKYLKDLKKTFDELLHEKIASANNTSGGEAPITELVSLIIQYAYDNRASDIHIEPEKEETLVRFRIDGVLHDILQIPKNLHDQIVSRIKVMSRLKTDEHQAAQDGKLQQEMFSEDLDVRVSVVPITRGEKIVMRLLSSKSRQFALTELGMRDRDLSNVKEAISRPFGMILSTGPTGSGKTTSIYALVKLLNTRDVNIATIEDPVEYDISGINQIQVNPKTNLTFASGLRSILRQDPNVIFVGEIRDSETAEIAINSATTGHLVVSTLHTNDAATALPRLLDMGIEPYLVASTVNAIIGQRLVRKICEKCRYSVELDIKELQKQLPTAVLKKHFGLSNNVRVYQGKGCEVCHHSGYLERVGLFEVLLIKPEIRDLIVSKASSEKIKEKAVEMGMTTMLDDGLDKVTQGVTTIEEVLRVTRE